MKRFLRAGIPLLVMLACAANAWAGLRYEYKPLAIRHYGAPASTRNSGYLGGTTLVGWNDSLWVTHNSSNTQAALVADTTAWFSLDDRGFAPYVLGADSLSLLAVYVTPTYGQGSSPAADSFTVTLQGSFNGVDVAAGVATDVVELGSSNCFWKPFAWTRGSTAATLTNVNMGMFPLYRVILKDFTGTTGQFEVGAAFWKDVGGEASGDRAH